jgi:hypothetical protein
LLIPQRRGNNMKTYTLIKFFHEFGRRPKVIRKGLSLEQAQAICKDPKTSKLGKWFYGYEGE